MVYNHIGRAYGILANAHSISSKETMNLLSLMRWAWIWDCFPGVDVVGGRVVHRHAAGAFAKTVFGKAVGGGTRLAAGRHVARTIAACQPPDPEADQLRRAKIGQTDKQ